MFKVKTSVFPKNSQILLFFKKMVYIVFKNVEKTNSIKTSVNSFSSLKTLPTPNLDSCNNKFIILKSNYRINSFSKIHKINLWVPGFSNLQVCMLFISGIVILDLISLLKKFIQKENKQKTIKANFKHTSTKIIKILRIVGGIRPTSSPSGADGSDPSGSDGNPSAPNWFYILVLIIVILLVILFYIYRVKLKKLILNTFGLIEKSKCCNWSENQKLKNDLKISKVVQRIQSEKLKKVRKITIRMLKRVPGVKPFIKKLNNHMDQAKYVKFLNGLVKSFKLIIEETETQK